MNEHGIEQELCGCGKPTRYHISKEGGGSCNKYFRCPTYEELREKLVKLNRYENALKQIMVVNAMDYEYRTWAKQALEE